MTQNLLKGIIGTHIYIGNLELRHSFFLGCLDKVNKVSIQQQGSHGFDPHYGSVLKISLKDTNCWFYPGNRLLSDSMILRFLMQSS
ncbi:hypothetical protein DPMN_179600 [Dreissena polymorpha]|uniref:Uncharacterized protein n=1 Tax=Dreissena polymorpha TaxID=45954 RepID=A0A9D4IMH4_DREPO|nr:hypothetical protein DPMN_179600 [Dreissena polymorpha]